MNLHRQITDAIEQAEWVWQGVIACADHPIWPSTTGEIRHAEHHLRGLAEDRDILRRHAPCDGAHSYLVHRIGLHEVPGPMLCCRCVRWTLPCEEQLSVARRHGIDPEAAE